MQKEKKKKEQYSRIFKIDSASLLLDPENEQDKVNVLANADITSIVFACAVAKGFTSVDLRQIDTKKMRGGWKRVVFNCGQREWVEICKLGPLKTEGPVYIDDDFVKNVKSVIYSFEWMQS